MFDKNKFAQILKNISETYTNQRDFSKKSEINRTYLSQYMNMKLDKPPKPDILEKLANASHGITNYDELMTICGYSDYDFDKMLYKTFGVKDSNLNTIIDELEFTNDEKKIIFNFFINPKEGYSYIHDLSNKSFQNFEIVFTHFLKAINYLDLLDSNNIEKVDTNIINDVINRTKNYNFQNYLYQLLSKINSKKNKDKYYMCPVYGQISAGKPNWAEECIEGRLPIDPDLMGIVNPQEHFFLRVNGESMNNVVKNGAFALIHKQDMVEDGEIAVVLVNGYDATLKRFTKKGDVVVLEPDSTDPSFKTQIYDKTTSIKILGKYVGKMEINK